LRVTNENQHKRFAQHIGPYYPRRGALGAGGAFNKKKFEFFFILMYKLYFQEAILKTSAIFTFVFFLVFGAGGAHLDSQEEIPIIKNVSLYQQYQQTMKTIKSLGDTLLDYVDEFDKAPQANSLKELLASDCGNGLTFAEFFFDEIPEEQIPLKDVWENELLYKSEKNRFWIASSGSDRQFNGFEQIGACLSSDDQLQGKDIIYCNGRFVLFPIEKKEFDSFLRLFLEAISGFR